MATQPTKLRGVATEGTPLCAGGAFPRRGGSDASVGVPVGILSSPNTAKTGDVNTPTSVFVDPREAGSARPKATLTTLTLLGVIYTASISGGYGLESSVKAGGPFLTLVFLCAIPFVWGIPVSLCVAELSCAIPSNAGPIMWANVSFAPWFTFATVLWTMMLNFVDNSLYPTVFADYCATLFHLSPIAKALTKVVFLWSCAIVNIFGVHIVGTFSLFIMVITILPFAMLFLIQMPHGFDWGRISDVPAEVNWALFLPVVAWNFSGFDSAGNVIEEVANPDKTFVRALVLMVVAGLATYIPPVLVGASAAGLADVPWSHWEDGFWVRVGEAVGGFSMASIVMAGGAISTLGLMTTLLTTTSRSLAGMGTLNAFPEFFSRWISKYDHTYHTPVRSIIFTTAVTCVLAVSLTFDVLVAVDQILYALRLIAILLSFLRLRAAKPSLARPYRVPGGTVGAAVCGVVPIVFSIFLLVMSMQGGSVLFASTLGIVFGTLLFSYLAVRLYRPHGFEGAIVDIDPDAPLDAQMGAYGAMLCEADAGWAAAHPDPHENSFSSVEEGGAAIDEAAGKPKSYGTVT